MKKMKTIIHLLKHDPITQAVALVAIGAIIALAMITIGVFILKSILS